MCCSTAPFSGGVPGGGARTKPPNRLILTSGATSNDALKVRTPSDAMSISSIWTGETGLIPRESMTAQADPRTSLSIASSRTTPANRRFTKPVGTLPLRKPLIFICPASLRDAACRSMSTKSAGTATSRKRMQCLPSVTVAWSLAGSTTAVIGRPAPSATAPR